MDNEKLFELIEKMYIDINTKMDKIHTDFKLSQEELKNEIKKTNIIIENDIKPKIHALFDGYKQNTEQLTRIESEVTKHDEFILKRVK